MIENMEIWDRARAVPNDAQKPIQAGKLKGFTNVNPVWRIQKLTELFGPCGFGWVPEITRQWLEEKEGVVCAFVNINLYIKIGEEWSRPIPGTGGSRLVSQTRNGADVSDECFKMAYTDAISVAAKSLGLAADIHYKLDAASEDHAENANAQPPGSEKLRKRDQGEIAKRFILLFGDSAQEKLKEITGHEKTADMTYDEYGFAMDQLDKYEHRLEVGGNA